MRSARLFIDIAAIGAMLALAGEEARASQRKFLAEEVNPLPPKVDTLAAPPKVKHAITQPKARAYNQRINQRVKGRNANHRRRP